MAEIGQRRRQLLKLLSDFPVARDGTRAGEALNFPEHRAAAVVIFVSRGGVDEQSLLAIGTQPRIGEECNAAFGGAGEQLHDFRREPLQRRQLICFVVSDENDVEVGTVVQLGAAQFSQPDDRERRAFELVFAQDDFKRVLQARVGQRRQFGEVLLKVRQAENVAQAEPHQLRLMIAAQPEPLVFVIAAMAQVVQDFLGGLAAAQAAAQFQFIHKVGRADGDFREKLRAVEQE